MVALKRKGFSDSRLAHLLGVREKQLRKKRWELGVYPTYKRVDTCALQSLQLAPLICTQPMKKSAKHSLLTVTKSWS
jgi:hypothetical protein